MTNAIHHGYIGSLVIDTDLVSTHYKLRYLESRVLVDTFYSNRFRLNFVPAANSTTITQLQVNKAIERVNCIEDNSKDTEHMPGK